MKKIFGFIGSPLRGKSNTFALTGMLLDRLAKKAGPITCDMLTAGDVTLQYCQGCWTCMTKGHECCPQDRLDDMPMLKTKMREADFIILGTPVHTGHMSGQMKTFFDRLASWYHAMILAGKPGATVVTTGGTPDRALHDFLAELMGCLGIKPVAALGAVCFSPGAFLNREEAEKKADEVAGLIYPYLSGEKRVESDDRMERCFQAMKTKIISGKNWLAGYRYWKDHQMLELDSYEAFLEKRGPA